MWRHGLINAVILVCNFFLLPTVLSQQSGGGTCGDGQIGNGICADPTLCCSRQGYCGSTIDYCSSGGATPASAPSFLSPFNTEYPTVPVTPYPTMTYSNCPNLDNVMTVNLAYYQSLAAWRDTSCNRLRPREIDVSGGGYTHLAYAFASIDSNDNLIPWDNDYNGEVSLYNEFNGLKKHHPLLKTLITIGGWTFTDFGKPTRHYFSNIASSESRRAYFAKSCVDFLQKYNFDGVDIDWEFPGISNRGGSQYDYENVPLLLQAIRDAFIAANRSHYLLAMATPIGIQYLQAGYKLSAMSPYVDFFSVLAYAVSGRWSSGVGANTDLPFVQKTVDYILNAGVPPNQTVLGLAAFGLSFNLANATCNTAGCPFTGLGPCGCGGNYGNIPLFTIEEYIAGGRYNAMRFNNVSSSLELVVNDTNWISYDNVTTWNIRTTYAVEKCLRGYFWWAIDMLTAPAPLSPRAGPKPVPPTLSPTVFATIVSKQIATSRSSTLGRCSVILWVCMFFLFLLLTVFL